MRPPDMATLTSRERLALAYLEPLMGATSRQVGIATDPDPGCRDFSRGMSGAGVCHSLRRKGFVVRFPYEGWRITPTGRAALGETPPC